MINLGCIEINPWHSTYRKPDYPDYLMLDLDPEEISFEAVIDTALVIKELCDKIKIPSLLQNQWSHRIAYIHSAGR